VEFRERLLATLRAIRPVLEVPGILVVGSEVPNLIEPRAASTLVVSFGSWPAIERSMIAASRTVRAIGPA